MKIETLLSAHAAFVRAYTKCRYNKNYEMANLREKQQIAVEKGIIRKFERLEKQKQDLNYDLKTLERALFDVTNGYE